MDDGKQIRSIFESYYDGEPDIEWEVDAAVRSFDIFSSRWTTEILCCLYVAGLAGSTNSGSCLEGSRRERCRIS